MNQAVCSICRHAKAYANCGLCETALCKDCEQFLEPDHFAFLDPIPKNLTLAHYCSNCFDEHVTPTQVTYTATMERAREVYIIFDSQHVPGAVRKKAKRTVTISNCKDRDETILRLGFRTIEQGFNAMIHVEVFATQIRNHAHQKNSWTGTGLPVDMDIERYERTIVD